MKPYLNNGHYFLRVTLGDQRSRLVACGTTDKATADAVTRMVATLRAKRQWAPLTAVVEKRTTLPKLFDAYDAGELPAFMARLDDPDVSVLVEQWAKETKPKYVVQVRRLIVKGERFPLSNFRRRTIARFIADLKVQGPTKNRYKAAFSSLANWLVDREYLESNPTIRLKVGEENDPRILWLSWDRAQAVCDGSDSPVWRALFRLCYGGGVEISAALRTRASDVNEQARTVRARGTKTVSRDRVVKLWPWAEPGFYEYAKPFIGDAPLFAGIDYQHAYRAHRAIVRAVLKDTSYTIHDARHTYAVNALKAGLRAEVVAHQLGHVNANLVRKVYGRYVPDASDYETTEKPAIATPRATRTARGR